MNAWRCVAFGMLVYGAALIVQAPASLADVWLAQLTQGDLRLTDTQGTLWHGSATLGDMPFSWQFQSGYLLLGQLRVILTRPVLSRPMEINITPSHLVLNNIDVWLPLAPLVNHADARLKSLGLGGQLHLTTTHLVIDQAVNGMAGMAGMASVDWIHAQSALSRVSSLGSYHITLHSAPNQMDAQLSTLQGPLWLQGQGKWTPQTGFHLTGNARAQPIALQGLLAVIATPTGPVGNRTYVFSWPMAHGSDGLTGLKAGVLNQ